MTSALQHIEGRPRLIVFYEDLIDDLERELPRLAAYLGMPERAEQADVQRAARAFMDKGLQHHRTSIVEMAAHPAITSPVKTLFSAQWQAAHGEIASVENR